MGRLLGRQGPWWFAPPSAAGEEKLDDLQHSAITFGPRAGCKNMTSPFQSFLCSLFFFNQLWKTPLASQFCFLQDCTYCLFFKSKREVIIPPSCRAGAPLRPPHPQAPCETLRIRRPTAGRAAGRLCVTKRGGARGHVGICQREQLVTGGRGTAGHLGWASARHLPYSPTGLPPPPPPGLPSRGAQRRREDAGSSLLLNLSPP